MVYQTILRCIGKPPFPESIESERSQPMAITSANAFRSTSTAAQTFSRSAQSTATNPAAQNRNNATSTQRSNTTANTQSTQRSNAMTSTNRMQSAFNSTSANRSQSTMSSQSTSASRPGVNNSSVHCAFCNGGASSAAQRAPANCPTCGTGNQAANAFFASSVRR